MKFLSVFCQTRQVLPSRSYFQLHVDFISCLFIESSKLISYHQHLSYFTSLVNSFPTIGYFKKFINRKK